MISESNFTFTVAIFYYYSHIFLVVRAQLGNYATLLLVYTTQLYFRLSLTL